MREMECLARCAACCSHASAAASPVKLSPLLTSGLDRPWGEAAVNARGAGRATVRKPRRRWSSRQVDPRECGQIVGEVSERTVDAAARVWSEATAVRDHDPDVAPPELARLVVVGALNASPEAVLLTARVAELACCELLLLAVDSFHRGRPVTICARRSRCLAPLWVFLGDDATESLQRGSMKGVHVDAAADDRGRGDARGAVP